jgi:hypothetical protein
MSAPHHARPRKKPGEPRKVQTTVDPEVFLPLLCVELKKGLSLDKALKAFDPVTSPTRSTVLDWVTSNPKFHRMYSQAKEIGYYCWADEIVDIADTKHEVDSDGELVKFDPIDVAMTKFRIDTRKWMLSKMLPKIYGDKLTNVHVGADGAPIQIAAMDLKGLSSEELASLQALMAKAHGE